ncbi:MAG: pilus assembly protein [Thiohalorhabdus sp.]
MNFPVRAFTVLALLALCAGPVGAAERDNYCYDNPAIASDLKPNIVVLLDTSESMKRAAYADYGSCPADNKYDFWGCYRDDELVNSYDSNQKYPGYADNDYWYKQGDKGWEVVEKCTDSGHCDPEEPYWRDHLGPDNDDNTGATTWYSGNFLNFLLMPRMDMARVVLVGGKGASRQKDTNKYETEHGEVFEPPESEERTGVLHEVETDARWGVASTNKQDGASIDEPIGNDNLTNVISEVQNWSAGGDAPLAEALWTVAGYFAQETEASAMPGDISGDGPEYNNGDIPTTDNKDPFNYDGEYPECANSYVLLISDGMPNADDNLPDDLTAYGAEDLDYDLADDNWETGDYGLDNVAYYMWANDFRPEMDGNQTIQTFPVYAFGDNEDAKTIMQNSAVNGAFEDLADSDGEKDELPTYVEGDCDLDPDTNNKEGVNCEEWDENLDDSPDAYFQAGKGTNLENQIRKAINAILERVSTGSTVATISTQTRSGGVLLQAYYQPQKTVIDPEGDTYNLSWRGHLRTLWTDPAGNVRDDNSQDDELILDDDHILSFEYDSEGREVEVVHYPDDGEIDGSEAKDNIPDTCADPSDSSQVTKTTNTEVPPVWEAGVQLEQRPPGTVNDGVSTSSREIYYNDGDPDDPSDDYLRDLDVDSEVADILGPYWQADDSDLVPSELIKFIRGLDNPDGNTEDYRVRQADDLTATDYGEDSGEDVWKLGAIITSTPRVLRPGPVSSYANEGAIGYTDYYTSEDVEDREPMVFVGANDGMLHAFYSGSVEGASDDEDVTATLEEDGGASAKEAWGFIPQNALPYLRWYGEMDAECNIPTVDYRFQLVDAAVAGEASDSMDNADAWRTLLVGTMGFGGQAIECDDVDGDDDADTLSSSVFVLDVTDPEEPELLWERNLQDSSLTLSTPAVVRRGDTSTQGDWYLVLGSGPLDPEAESFVDTPQLYTFNLRSGELARTIDLTDSGNFQDDNPAASSAAVGEPLPFDPDQDNLTDAVYVGTYAGPEEEKGRLYRLHLDDEVEEWDLTLAAQVGSSTGRPFFAAPGGALDPDGDLWIYGGTGRFFSESDQTDDLSQYFFGFVDQCWGDGSGSEEGDIYGGENCAGTVTVLDDLAEMDDVEVRAEPVSYECRCGSSFFQTASDGDSTECPDNSELVVKEAEAVEYSGCPWAEDCGTNDPSELRNEVKDRGGWYWELAEGERIFSQPAVLSGLVNAAGFTPASDICTPGGETVSYAVDYRTGTAPPKPTFLSAGGTSENEDSDKVTIESGVELGEGVPPVGESYAGSAGGREGEINTHTQPSTGEIKQLRQQVEQLEKGILYRQEQ